MSDLNLLPRGAYGKTGKGSKMETGNGNWEQKWKPKKKACQLLVRYILHGLMSSILWFTLLEREIMYLEWQFVQDLMMLDLLCYWLRKNSFPYPLGRLQEYTDRAVFLLVSVDHPCTTCMLVKGSSLPHR